MLKGKIVLFLVKTLIDLLILWVIFKHDLLSSLFKVGDLLEIVTVLLDKVSPVFLATFCEGVFFQAFTLELVLV